MEGPDAVSFVQGLVSADVDSLPNGRVGRSFFLTPRGMVRFLLWVLKDDRGLGMICERGEGLELAETLDYYRIRVKATIRVGSQAVSALVGPKSLWTNAPEEASWERKGEDFRVAAVLASLPRYFFTGDAPEGAKPVGELAWRAVRVESGEPSMSRDLDQRTIPQETGDLAEAAISFTKGCFLGQELAARIDSRGRVNRILRGLVIRANILPPEGAEVRRDGRVVGRITSVSESLELRAPVGLCLIRRGTDPGDQVGIHWEGGETSARVRSLPMGPALLDNLPDLGVSRAQILSAVKEGRATR